MRTRGIGLSIAVACAVLVGCQASTTSDGPQAGPATANAGKVGVSASDSFLAATLTDWVSFAEHIVIASVTSEEAVPDPATDGGDEGYVPRRVTLRIDEQLWRGPGTRPLPNEVSFFGQGWVLRAGERYEATTAGAPRLQRGQTFLLPLTRFGDEVGPLSGHSPVLMNDGRAVPDRDQDDEAVQQVGGKTAAEVRQLLARTGRDADAIRYEHLPPYERVRAVMRERAKRQNS